jgi:hypothetical protein
VKFLSDKPAWRASKELVALGRVEVSCIKECPSTSTLCYQGSITAASGTTDGDAILHTCNCSSQTQVQLLVDTRSGELLDADTSCCPGGYHAARGSFCPCVGALLLAAAQMQSLEHGERQELVRCWQSVMTAWGCLLAWGASKGEHRLPVHLQCHSFCLCTLICKQLCALLHAIRLQSAYKMMACWFAVSLLIATIYGITGLMFIEGLLGHGRMHHQKIKPAWCVLLLKHVICLVKPVCWTQVMTAWPGTDALSARQRAADPAGKLQLLQQPGLLRQPPPALMQELTEVEPPGAGSSAPSARFVPCIADWHPQ